MNIVYAADDNFAEMLGISMLSLFENNRECEEITVYILDGGISDENRTRLASISEKYCRKINFVDTDNILKDNMKQKRGSLSTFSRLYITRLLPADVKKALYLDCDLLVLNDLSEMYLTDTDNFFGAAINDCVSDAHKESIDLDKDDNYFNAGVLLVNVEEWRKNNLSEEFEAFSKRYNDNVPYADQGILNGVLSKKLIPLGLKYNCYTALFDFSYKDLITFRKPSRYYSGQEVEEALSNPVIVHFTTSFLSLRPWIEGCNHPYAQEWLKYKSMTPWADIPLRKDNRSGKKKLAVKVYKKLPHKLAVCSVGFLHARVMPRIKNKK